MPNAYKYTVTHLTIVVNILYGEGAWYEIVIRYQAAGKPVTSLHLALARNLIIYAHVLVYLVSLYAPSSSEGRNNPVDLGVLCS